MHRTPHASPHLLPRVSERSRSRTGRRLALVTFASVLLSASGCAAGSTEPDASGVPVVLHMATNDGPDSPTGAAIAAYARAVADLSDGSVQVVPVWEAAGADPDDWDQAVARTVIDGTNELGLIPARAFDVLGVDTLQPLQTPFLLTTARRVDEVISSPLVDELMVGLEDVGLTGLGLSVEDLRRILSYGEPITKPSHLDGRSIRAPRSDMTEAVFASVGAEVTDIGGDAWRDAVAQGQVHGVEGSLAFMAGLAREHSTTTAGNIVLFPKVNVLVVNRSVFEELEEAARGALRQAAVAIADVADLRSTEAEGAAAYCAAGGRLIVASDADAGALMAAMSATTLPRSTTRAVQLTRAIEDLVADLPQIDPVPGCEPSPVGTGGPSAPAAGTDDVLLTVDTQIGDAAPRSPVVTAALPFEGCTTVQDTASSIDDSDPAKLTFAGTKVVECADGTVTIEYRASMDTTMPGITSGTWRITESTLQGVRAGEGLLAGDGGACQTIAPADACIRDTYTGTLRP